MGLCTEISTLIVSSTGLMGWRVIAAEKDLQTAGQQLPGPRFWHASPAAATHFECGMLCRVPCTGLMGAPDQAGTTSTPQPSAARAALCSQATWPCMSMQVLARTHCHPHGVAVGQAIAVPPNTFATTFHQLSIALPRPHVGSALGWLFCLAVPICMPSHYYFRMRLSWGALRSLQPHYHPPPALLSSALLSQTPLLSAQPGLKHMGCLFSMVPTHCVLP